MPSVGSSRIRTLGSVSKRAGDGQLLLLAAAEDAAFAFEHFLENGKQFQHAVHLVRCRCAVDHQADFQIFPNREIRENVPALRHITEA